MNGYGYRDVKYGLVSDGKIVGAYNHLETIAEEFMEEKFGDVIAFIG
jgi:hypothetical protein